MLTLTELVVVISILTIILSLTMPAVQQARESARRISCANNLRQTGIAIQAFETAHRQYPSDGWGWAWVGDAGLTGSGQLDVPGSWIHNLLPFIEQQAIWELTKTRQGRDLAIQMPIGVFSCASRRDSAAYPYTQVTVPLRNATVPQHGNRSDYAICAGDRLRPVGPGPTSVEALREFPPPSRRLFSGVSFVRSRIGSRDLSDGTAYTLAVSEKLVPTAHYLTGQSLGDDQTMLIGDDIDSEVWRAMGNRADGLNVADPFE